MCKHHVIIMWTQDFPLSHSHNWVSLKLTPDDYHLSSLMLKWISHAAYSEDLQVL